jgi:hypothetical protein
MFVEAEIDIKSTLKEIFGYDYLEARKKKSSTVYLTKRILL